MWITTFLNDSKGGTTFGSEPVEFHAGEADFLTATVLMSSAKPCKRYFFSELPPGYTSKGDFSSRRQLCVLLSGQLVVVSSSGDVQQFEAGDVIRLEDTEYETPARSVRVTSSCAARVLSVQID